MNVDPVILQLKADIAEYQRKLNSAHQLTDQRLNAIEQRGDRMAKGLSRSFGGISNSLRGLAVSLAGAFTVREIAGLIDKGKQLDAQLKLATRTSGDFAKAQDDVRRIAAETRNEIGAMAALYGNFQRNAVELGISQEDVARATETVSKSMKISGATAVDSAQGIRQLVQALQSGVLRGDEFNSIMESSPRLARLLADSLGVPVGALRKMAEEGELTSDKLVRAFTDKKFTAGIDAEFKEMPVTFGEALTQIENAAIAVFGAFDRGGQFSNAILNFAKDGTDGFADLESSAASFGRTVSSELAGVVAIATNVIQGIEGINAALNAVGMNSNLGDIASLAVNPLGALVRASPAYSTARDRRMAELTPSLAQNALGMIGGAVSDIGKVAPGRAITPARSGGAKKRGGRANSAAKLAEQAAREGANLDSDEIRARIDLATSAQERADLEKQALDMERAELIRGLEARKLMTAALLEKINTIYGTPGTVGPDGLTVDGKPGLIAQKINREFEQREAQIRNDMLAREGEVLDAWTELETNTQERNKMEQVALALQHDIQKNLLDQEIATGRIADADKAISQLKSTQEASRQRLLRSQRSPGQRYVDDIRESADNINDAIENIEIQGLEALNDGLVEAIMGAKSLGDVFKSVANQIIADLLRIAIQKSITAPLAEALFGGGGGGGGGGGFLGGLFGSIFGGGKASGGPVSRGTPYMVGESGRELFVPDRSGMIIPAGQVNAMAAGGAQGGGVTTVRLMLSGDIDARIQSVSAGVALEMVRAAAPQIVDASARETMARANRPRI